MRPLLICGLILMTSLPQISNAQSGSCGEYSAGILGKLYNVTNPINELTNPSQIEQFVRNNAHLLNENGPLMICTRNLGYFLMNQGLNAFRENDYNRGYESAINMGANMEQARDVASSLQEGAVDAYMMGEELMWLSQVIPAAASGNWDPFNQTGTQMRLTIRQLWPLINSDPTVRNTVTATMTQFGPLVQHQVAMLAVMSGQ